MNKPLADAARALPCPFCGGAGEPQFENRIPRGKWAFIECVGCGAKGPDVRTGYADIEEWRDDAVKEWNRRVSAPPNPSVGDRVAHINVGDGVYDARWFEIYPRYLFHRSAP